ncbi:MAG: S41 family peptidase [Odoribacter sp.]
MKNLVNLSILLLTVSTLISCHKNDVDPDDDSDLTLEQRMNKFIAKEMQDIYLWSDQIKNPNTISINQKPADFLKAIKYTEDNWSYLEENDATTKTSAEGSATGFGYKIIFYKISANTVIGMIQYVYPNTPAAKAGLKRGDMIVRCNDNWLDESNYLQVVTDKAVSLQTGFLTETQLIASNKSYELEIAKFNPDPILLDTVLQIENKKIGYLVYTSFIDNQTTSLSDLNNAIGRIKEAQVDEFILDLRYNTGGMLTAAKQLGSLLAPADAVGRSALFIHKQWNETYQQKFQGIKDALEIHFDPGVLTNNLDLRKIYILTGKNTASASEVIISGLQAYLSEVILIGEKTVGKYAGMSKLSSPKELEKWVLWPVTFTYTNLNGESVKGGIEPHFTEIEYSNYLPPFGNSEDPLLKKAIELITGKTATVTLQSKSKAFSPTNWQPIKTTEKYLLID